MNWFSLIPAALGALGGLFGGGGSTATSSSSTSSSIDPVLKQAGQDALTKAQDIWKKPYVAYTGERVAGPTASRAAIDPIMSSIGTQVQNGMNDSNGYQAKISQMLGRGPGRVVAPTLVNGGATSSYIPGA